jgi:8-amino-7-oxononanoate synthase
MLNLFSSSLQNLKEKNLYRKLTILDSIDAPIVQKGRKKLISFASNDYLGLAQNTKIKKAGIAAIEKFGLGAASSRYITGNNSLYEKLEKEIAHQKNCDAAIVFSSGYTTAIGVIPALVKLGDLIVADRLIHSSLIDGAKLSGARLMRFQHNSLSHCEEILAENRVKFERCLIITETIFSMDGDVGKTEELLKLANRFNCLLLSDSAHDLWIKTIANHQNHLQLGTLSKSIGTIGGYVAGNKIVIDYLRNFAKSAIYSTALPPCVLAASLASLKIIAKKNLGQKALRNAEYFCELTGLAKPESAIVVIIIGDNQKVLEIAKRIERKGFLISAIRPPTVEINKARLRITFSAAHNKKQIEELAKTILFEMGCK